MGGPENKIKKKNHPVHGKILGKKCNILVVVQEGSVPREGPGKIALTSRNKL